MRHLVEVVKIVEDVEPRRSTVKLFFIDLPAEEMQVFADKIDARCDELSGENEGYEVAYTTIDEIDVKTLESAESWLLTFGVESVFDDEEDEKGPPWDKD